MNNRHDWHAYDGGKTLGHTGYDGGVIVRDEEHDGGARITLEQGTQHAPFAITVVIYGFGDHTRFFADEPTAEHAFGEMQAALIDILALIPSEDDPDPVARYEATSDAIAAFVERFP